MRSTAEIGITLTSTKLAPPLASTGEMFARRPLIRTSVARLRRETCEPPFVEPEEMLPFSEPMLFEPKNAGWAFFRTSSKSVLTPVFSISGAPKTVTGMAGEPAAIGIRDPVTTNFSIFWTSLVETVGWAAKATPATKAVARPNRPREAAARCCGLFIGCWFGVQSDAPPGGRTPKLNPPESHKFVTLQPSILKR